jgi:6-phosphofructokinase 1
MNAAVRAAARFAMFKGCHVFGVKEGYHGLVNDMITELMWNDVSGVMQLGGTLLGTARCDDFRQRRGRLQAAKNMVKHGISNLVVIGGDGSLTGANLFREEWAGLLEELVKTNQLNKHEIAGLENLNIVGMVGSIDNDFCGTDITIGTDSALHRIIEAVDALVSTASSHQRSFVLEVMGRHCGYLALMSGLAGAADWVLVPEDAPSEGWEMKMCSELKLARDGGRRYSLVIVAEGAIDQQGRAITSQYVKQVIEQQLQHDTRITVLGHVQRGGTPSAYDRILGCRYGAEAVLALLEATPETPSCVVAMQGNRIQRLSLMECVENTQKVSVALKNKDYNKALSLRSSSFAKNLALFKKISAVRPPDLASGQTHFTFAIMTVGAPACGMNSAIYAFARMSLFAGHKVMAIHDGFVGLVDGKVDELTWMSVNEWCKDAGSRLGTNRNKPSSIGKPLDTIAQKLIEYNIQGLVIIGGFEAYHSIIELYEARDRFSAFKIPLVCIPATISNNVPGTDISLGSDTALNAIVEVGCL